MSGGSLCGNKRQGLLAANSYIWSY